MPLKKLHGTDEKLNSHLGSSLLSADPPSMLNGRDWGEVDLPALGIQSIAEVTLLEIHEEGLVETAHSFERFAADCQRGSFHPSNYTGMTMGPGTQVFVAENGNIANQLAQSAMLKQRIEGCRKCIA